MKLRAPFENGGFGEFFIKNYEIEIPDDRKDLIEQLIGPPHFFVIIDPEEKQTVEREISARVLAEEPKPIECDVAGNPKKQRAVKTPVGRKKRQ